MFDPMHNAVDHYYAVNGSLAGSLKEDLRTHRGIGIVNWHGGLKGKNCAFFAGLGLRQILAGYYDSSDEDGAAIVEWLRHTQSVPEIIGQERWLHNLGGQIRRHATLGGPSFQALSSD